MSQSATGSASETGSAPKAESVLEDVRVVELTQALAGPFLAMMLGDLGADVIKVERPGSGDSSRGWGPPFLGGESTYFMAVNRNKRSVTCDYGTEEGRRLLCRLFDSADVVLVNERRESRRQEIGIDYAALSQRNPCIVYCSISGFGMTGPYAGRAGYDIIAQAMAGMMSLTGPIDGPPFRVPAAIADMATAMYGVSSILAALMVRERTGHGQYIDLSLLESQAWWTAIFAASYLGTGEKPPKLGNDHPSISPYGVFQAAEGYLVIGCGTESLWRRLCRLLQMPDTATDPRFATNADRVVNRRELTGVIETHLADRSAAEWCEAMEEAGIPAGPINDIPSMLDDPHMLARGFLVEQQHPAAGALRTFTSPIRLSDTPATYRLPPPLLGQHTAEVLDELGYSDADQSRMRDVGAV